MYPSMLNIYLLSEKFSNRCPDSRYIKFSWRNATSSVHFSSLLLHILFLTKLSEKAEVKTSWDESKHESHNRNIPILLITFIHLAERNLFLRICKIWWVLSPSFGTLDHEMLEISYLTNSRKPGLLITFSFPITVKPTRNPRTCEYVFSFVSVCRVYKRDIIFKNWKQILILYSIFE